MSSAIILQHVPYASPGRIVPIFRDFGIPCDVRHLYRGDEVPTDLDDVRLLVVLGGPMHVADAEENADDFPFLAKEIELLKRMVHLDRPTLGIDLGAQLLAHAAGAKVTANVKMGPPAGPGQPPKPVEPIEPLPELGWTTINFPFPGGTEPIVFGAVDQSPVFQWHFDTFDLPKLPSPPNAPPPPAPPPPTGNALIASSRLCRNQAFRFKNRQFGFQFHLECLEADIEAIVANRAADLPAPGIAATIKEESIKHYRRYDQLTTKILKNFVQFLKIY